MFVWLAMISGLPYDELCALRWDDVDFESGELLALPSIPSIAQAGSHSSDTDTMVRRPRRIELDPHTITLLRAYQSHCAAHAAINGIERHPNPYVFSPSPDGWTEPEPDAVARRFAQMCARLGWEGGIHQLRQYSATELIEAGVDMLAFSWRLHRGLSRIQRRPRR
jgi:integrase